MKLNQLNTYLQDRSYGLDIDACAAKTKTAGAVPPLVPESFGGAEGDRTPGLGIANAALSQLSYCPTHDEKDIREWATSVSSVGNFFVEAHA